jgi:hypothetical protein
LNVRLSSVVACIAISPLLMGASEPVLLQPSSQWDVDYGDDSCRLIRMFGEGADQTKLVLESIAPDEMSMLVVGRQLGGASPGAPVKARFLPVQDNPFAGLSALAENRQAAATWSSVPLMRILKDDGSLPPDLKRAMADARSRAKSGERPPRIDLGDRAVFRRERLEFATKAVELEIEARRGHPIILETGSLGEPIKAFDDCMRDLEKSWGVDPNIQDNIVLPAWTPSISAWFSGVEYPHGPLERGEESEVTFRLLIDADGRVTKCTATSQYDAPQFNTAVCDALKGRAHFSPAELQDGTKVPSYYTNRVVFRL